MVPDITTKHIVERMYQLYFEGNSYQTIANIFNAENIGNKKWRDNTILEMIENPIYKGDYLHGKRNKYPAYYEDVVEPIVSKEMWENCQVQQKKILEVIKDIKLIYSYKNLNVQFVEKLWVAKQLIKRSLIELIITMDVMNVKIILKKICKTIIKSR